MKTIFKITSSPHSTNYELAKDASWFLENLENSERYPTAALLMRPETLPHFKKWLAENIRANLADSDTGSPRYRGIFTGTTFYAILFRDKKCALEFADSFLPELDAPPYEAILEVEKGKPRANRKNASISPQIA